MRYHIKEESLKKYSGADTRKSKNMSQRICMREGFCYFLYDHDGTFFVRVERKLRYAGLFLHRFIFSLKKRKKGENLEKKFRIFYIVQKKQV